MPLTVSSETHDLMKLMEHPWKFFDHLVRKGLFGFKKTATAMGAVIGVNMGFFLGAIVLMTAYETWGRAWLLAPMLILGLLTVAYAAYRCYQFVMVQVFHIIYGELRQQLKEKLYPKMVEKLAARSQFKVGRIMDEVFGRIPWLLRKPLKIIFKRIPLVGILPMVNEELQKGGSLEAQRVLDEEIDTFLVENIFQATEFKWLYWLLPLNTIIQGFLLWKTL